MRLCKFTFTILLSLPCLHTFWHAIPTSFITFLMFFKSLSISNSNTYATELFTMTESSRKSHVSIATQRPPWPTKGRVFPLSPLNGHLKFLHTFALKIRYPCFQKQLTGRVIVRPRARVRGFKVQRTNIFT